MSSNYFARMQKVNALQMHTGVLSLPNDFDISGTGVTRLLGINHKDFDPDSNLIVHSISLMNPFADGLVKKDVNDLFAVVIEAKAFRYSTNPVKKLTGNSFTSQGGAKTIIGDATNFNVCVTAGDYIFDGTYVHKVVTVDSAIEITVRDTIPFGELIPISIDFPGFVLASNGTDRSRVLLLRDLYLDYPAREFLSPANFALDSTVAIGVEVTLRSNDAALAAIPFMTKSINLDYDGDSCYTDLVAEIEYTPRVI